MRSSTSFFLIIALRHNLQARHSDHPEGCWPTMPKTANKFQLLATTRTWSQSIVSFFTISYSGTEAHPLSCCLHFEDEHRNAKHKKLIRPSTYHSLHELFPLIDGNRKKKKSVSREVIGCEGLLD